MRGNLISLYDTFCFLDQQIEEQILKTIAKKNEACKRLMKIPGIAKTGSISASNPLKSTRR
jgi:hypothetical protein